MGCLLARLLEKDVNRTPELALIPNLEIGVRNVFSIHQGDYNKIQAPRAFKTHLRYEFLKEKVEKEKLKVIVLLRNPKDILTSYFYMYKQSIMGCFPGDFHDFFALFKANQLEYGDVLQWTLGWWQARNLPNVLYIKYKDMKVDCANVLKQVADFLNVEHSDEALAHIVEECSFKNLKSQKMLEKVGSVDSIKRPANDIFFRKGIIGDWKNHFLDEEAEYLDELCEKYYKPVGLSFET